MNKKTIIIGGAGFIGHNLAIKLKENNFDVSIIDGLEVNNLTSVIGNYDNLPYPLLSKKIIDSRLDLLDEKKIPLYVEDARNYHSLSYIISKIKPEVIIHLAAVSHAARSNKNPYNTFDHSLRTLENALDVSRDNVKHFIFLSSSMVYGNFKTQKVNEESICEPIGIYGALKYAAEKIIIAYNQVFNLPYTILRPSALYGERCISRRVGQIFIENALFGKELKINGDGKEKLDFTY
jgi:nucleoside-diphosphate-sugar epimerase